MQTRVVSEHLRFPNDSKIVVKRTGSCRWVLLNVNSESGLKSLDAQSIIVLKSLLLASEAVKLSEIAFFDNSSAGSSRRLPRFFFSNLHLL